jgi:gliding motility-associated protein GldM
MAGGKMTPRQKMINLMYLVFIAMLALNMSKEVLSAFGLMNEKFESSNSTSLENNAGMLSLLEAKGTENPAQFGNAKKVADQVAQISKGFYDYIGKLKGDAKFGVEVDSETKKLPYESMDKGPHIDDTWFAGDGYSAKGKEIVATMDKYRSDMKSAIGNEPKLKAFLEEIEIKFNTKDVKDHEGVTKKYLEYHFMHFPAIASLAKLTSMQNDVKKSESDIYSALLGKAALDVSSMKNYTAIVIPEKSAFFSGEAVKGIVVLGRFDKSTVPTSVTVNGGSVTMEDGQAHFSLGAGGVGEHDILGKFNFLQDGKNVPIDIKGTYVVVPKPNSATISADKMNVVYRGVVNPMTISFAGVADSDVSANAAGLTKGTGVGKYNMSPGQGTEVTINVSAKLPNGGGTASDKRTFRIKNIPAPLGAVGGSTRSLKGAKSRLEVSQISAVMEDFDFELKLNVVQFSFKVPGQPTVIVNGDRVNAQCKTALSRATKGDQIIISDIKTKLAGSVLELKQTAPVIYELQ